jgi:hypothetical protein
VNDLKKSPSTKTVRWLFSRPNYLSCRVSGNLSGRTGQVILNSRASNPRIKCGRAALSQAPSFHPFFPSNLVKKEFHSDTIVRPGRRSHPSGFHCVKTRCRSRLPSAAHNVFSLCSKTLRALALFPVLRTVVVPCGATLRRQPWHYVPVYHLANAEGSRPLTRPDGLRPPVSPAPSPGGLYTEAPLALFLKETTTRSVSIFPGLVHRGTGDLDM